MSSPKPSFPPTSAGVSDKDSFVNLFINSKADFAPSETASSQSQSASNGGLASDTSVMAASSSVSYSVASVVVSPGSQNPSESNVIDTPPGQPLRRMPPRPVLLAKPLHTDMQTMPLAALASPKKEEVDLFSSAAVKHTPQGTQGASQLMEEPTKHESSSSLLDILNSPAPTSNHAGGSNLDESIHTWAAVRQDFGNVSSSFTSPVSETATRSHRDRPPSRSPSPTKQPTPIPSWATAPFRSTASDSPVIPPDRTGTLSPPRSLTASTQPNQSPVTVPLLVGSTPRPQAEYALSSSPPTMTPLGDALGNSHSDNSDNDDEDEEEEDRNTEANTLTEPVEKLNPRKKKKNIYPPEARKLLHDYFHNVSRNPSKQQRLEMVSLVGSNEKTIRIWFQNQRQKLAKLERRRISRINGLQPTLADLTAPGMPILPAPPRNMSMDSLQSGNFLQAAAPASFHGTAYQMPGHPPPTPGLPMPPPPTPGFPMHGATLSSHMNLQQIHHQQLQQHFQQQQQQQQGGQTLTYVTRAGIISPVTPTFVQNQATARAQAQQSQGGANPPNFIQLHHSNFNTDNRHPFLAYAHAPTSTSPTHLVGMVPVPSPPLVSPAMHAGGTAMGNPVGAYPSPDFVPSGSLPPPTPPAHIHFHAQQPVAHFSPASASVLPPLPDSAGVTPAFGSLQLANKSTSPQLVHHHGQGAYGHGGGDHQYAHQQGATHMSALGFTSVVDMGGSAPVGSHPPSAWTPSGSVAMQHATSSVASDYVVASHPVTGIPASSGAGNMLFTGEQSNVDGPGGSLVGTATGDWSSLLPQDDTASLASSMSMMSGAPLGKATGAGSKLAAHVMSFSTDEVGQGVGQHIHRDQQQHLGGYSARVQGTADARRHMQ